MYAKVGAISTSIHLNKPSMQHSPTHWNSKNYEKKLPENASKRVDFSKFSYAGEGHILHPIPPQTRTFGPRFITFYNLAPLCTTLYQGKGINQYMYTYVCIYINIHFCCICSIYDLKVAQYFTKIVGLMTISNTRSDMKFLHIWKS